MGLIYTFNLIYILITHYPIAKLMGVPAPLARLGAALFGSLLSESTKAIGRKIESDKKLSQTSSDQISGSSTGSASSINEEEAEDNNGIGWEEVAKDITKWITYDLLVPQGGGHVPVQDAFRNGAVAAVTAQIVFELTRTRTKNSTSVSKGPSQLLTSIVTSGLEGAALFGAYEACMQYFEQNNILVSKTVFEDILDFFRSR